MRCAIDFDENKPLAEQKVKAWGELQSIKDEPAYKEADIKDKSDRDYFFGYKCALDDVCCTLDNFVDDGQITKEVSEEIQDWLAGDLCMQLFSIIDGQEE